MVTENFHTTGTGHGLDRKDEVDLQTQSLIGSSQHRRADWLGLGFRGDGQDTFGLWLRVNLHPVAGHPR